MRNLERVRVTAQERIDPATLVLDLALAPTRYLASDLATAACLKVANYLAAALDHVRERANTYVGTVSKTMDRDYERAAERARELAKSLEHAHIIDNALKRATALALVLAMPEADLFTQARRFKLAVERARALDRDLVEARAEDAAHDLERAHALTDALIRGLSLDLSDADLRGADLSNMRLPLFKLDGALWSPSTVWPEGQEGAVRLRSVEVEPGVFRIDSEHGPVRDISSSA